MKIGIISDTHDWLEGVDLAMKVFDRHKIKMIIHAGDWTAIDTLRYCLSKANNIGAELVGVLGNNDDQNELSAIELVRPLESKLVFTVDLINIGVCHGHNNTVFNELLEYKLDVVVRGHSHNPLISSVGPSMIINPGSTSHSIPRSRYFVGSVAIFDTTNRRAELINL